MSKIDELIAELCPDGVEYKHLWEVTAWDKKFNGVERHKQQKVIKYHYLLAADLKNLQTAGGKIKLLTTNNSSLWTTEELAGDMVSDGEVVTIPWGGTANVQYYKGKFLTADNRIATSLDTNFLDNKFLYYFMLHNTRTLQSFYRGSGIQHPSMAKVLDLKIPVPPIEVQRAIVDILDKFTQLEAELEAELEARKKQYEHYRNQLLTFDDAGGVRWTTMADISRVTIGEFVHKNKQNPNGKYPVYNGGRSATGYYDHFNNDGNKIVVSARGAYAGFVNMITKPYWAGNSSYSIDITDQTRTNWMYVFYYLKSSEKKFTEQQQKGGIPAVSKKQIEQFSIPLPSMKEQNRIVSILDKFDKLVNDISEGLPAELKARRQQYEYYRNKLLTFTPLDTETKV